jgi:hypothetical protein
LFGHVAQDAEEQYALIDTMAVRAHQHSARVDEKTENNKRWFGPNEDRALK